MSQSEHEAQLRQQIFLFAIGIFLVAYLISLYRYRSFEWAMLTSSITFGAIVVVGTLLTAVVKLRDDDAGIVEQGGVANGPGMTGEYQASASTFDMSEQAAD